MKENCKESSRPTVLKRSAGDMLNVNLFVLIWALFSVNTSVLLLKGEGGVVHSSKVWRSSL